MEDRAPSPPKAVVAGASLQKLSDSICAPQYAASLKCLDDENYDKSKCQEFFDAYKECRKHERELRLEANRKSKRFFF
ncbi:unnamed protein product [Sphagnum compactum]